ncbi:hypothetical protein [Fimbriiglobus ruber]|uniref:Uncharacterized protein n=1 Tax=Fimbriiglobus ruber TaxID=1908690 RepID=A0A225E349_9BACT|nr:hypothetical protein [Fimbriiglobus ruber]OWK45218.1 hypothetical protein FRUB_01549 [Fimbriiglobus ruber]
MQTLPTPEQLKAYADQLPSIYRDVLTAIPEVSVNYRASLTFAIPVLVVYLNNHNPNYHEYDILAAVDRLERQKFLTVDHGAEGIFATPTTLGEELIATLTGKRPEGKAPFPDLPKPTW